MKKLVIKRSVYNEVMALLMRKAWIEGEHPRAGDGKFSPKGNNGPMGDDVMTEKPQKPVQHDGEFVLTRNGSRDFGEISPEIAGQIRRQAGKIRLRVGKHEGKTGDYGEKHIERPERLRQLVENGYQNARDLVQDVATSFDAIFKGDGPRLILSKRGTVTDITIFVELIPASDGDFYDVKTGLISRKNYFKKKTPLWAKPRSGV
jgi:hypothetical protein